MNSSASARADSPTRSQARMREGIAGVPCIFVMATVEAGGRINNRPVLGTAEEQRIAPLARARYL